METMKKQIILLGDSVRMQYQSVVAKKLADIAEVSGPDEQDCPGGSAIGDGYLWLIHSC